jgi:Sec-independent protein translocase protein TatA
MDYGSGGLGAVSAGFFPWLVIVVLIVVVCGVWKLTKTLWTMFGS